MNKLHRTVQRTIDTLDKPVVYHIGSDDEFDTYLEDLSSNNKINIWLDEEDIPEVIVFSGDDIPEDSVNLFDQATVVIIKETQTGSMKRRNTSHVHNNAFGDFIYLDDEGPHIIVYSREPKVIEEVGKPVTSAMIPFSPSLDLSREDIRELGRKTPYYRPAEFPIKVKCEFNKEIDVCMEVDDGSTSSTTTTPNPQDDKFGWESDIEEDKE